MKKALTGSQVYGPATNDSDIDIVLTLAEGQELETFLTSLGIEKEQTDAQVEYEPDGGYYFHLGPLWINIILADNETEVIRWNQATKMMCSLDPIDDREKRIYKFREFFII